MTVWTLREHIFCVHVCSGPLWLVPSVSWSRGTGSHLHLAWADSQQTHQQAEEGKQLREQGANDSLRYCEPRTRNTEQNTSAYRVVRDAPTHLMQYCLSQGTQNEQHVVHRWHHVWCCTFCSCCASPAEHWLHRQKHSKRWNDCVHDCLYSSAKLAAPMTSLEMQYCLHYGTQKIKQPILHRWHPFWCSAIYSQTNTEWISTLHRSTAFWRSTIYTKANKEYISTLHTDEQLYDVALFIVNRQ